MKEDLKNIEKNLENLENDFMRRCKVFISEMENTGEPPICIYNCICSPLCTEFDGTEKNRTET